MSLSALPTLAWLQTHCVCSGCSKICWFIYLLFFLIKKTASVMKIEEIFISPFKKG